MILDLGQWYLPYSGILANGASHDCASDFVTIASISTVEFVTS